MADENRNDQSDAADPRQEQSRGEIIPGKGFDAGTGYGGAGNSSAYSGESSYGGQAGYGGNSLRGSYAGGEYGREEPGEGEEPRSEGAGQSGSGAGSGADVPRGTDEHGDSGESGGGAAGGGPRGLNLDADLGGERRDPTR